MSSFASWSRLSTRNRSAFCAKSRPGSAVPTAATTAPGLTAVLDDRLVGGGGGQHERSLADGVLCRRGCLHLDVRVGVGQVGDERVAARCCAGCHPDLLDVEEICVVGDAATGHPAGSDDREGLRVRVRDGVGGHDDRGDGALGVVPRLVDERDRERGGGVDQQDEPGALWRGLVEGMGDHPQAGHRDLLQYGGLHVVVVAPLVGRDVEAPGGRATGSCRPHPTPARA